MIMEKTYKQRIDDKYNWYLRERHLPSNSRLIKTIYMKGELVEKVFATKEGERRIVLTD